MNTKERAAMQQALEALEVYGEHAKDCPQYPTYTRPQDYPKCDCGFEEAITALREALAEPVRKCDGLLCNDCGEYKQRYKDLPGLTEKDLCVCSLAEQAEQEPVGRWNWNEAKFEWLTKFDYHKHHMTPLYAAPVRTKDLTDDEIRFWIGRFPFLLNEKSEKWVIGLARAVIAADREKNK